MTRSKKIKAREETQDFLTKYKPSPVSLKRNKLNKNWMSLNYKKKVISIHFGPTLMLDNGKVIQKDRKVIKCNKVFGTRKMKLEIVRNKVITSGKRDLEKIEKISNSVIQMYAVDENLTKCYFSMGHLVELKLKDKSKIVLITHFEALKDLLKNGVVDDGTDLSTNLHFYCAKINDDSFLRFFEEITKIKCDEERKHFFLLGGLKQFELVNLDINFLFLNLINNLNNFNNTISENNKIKFFIFDAPQTIYERFDYNDFPVINLKTKNEVSKIISNKDKMNFNSIKNPILFLSPHFKYKFQDINMNNDMNNFINDNYTDFDGRLKVNFGKLIKDKEIKTSSQFGGVGSLIFNRKDLKHPLGINVGAVNNNFNNDCINEMISFEDENVKSLLTKYIMVSDENLCMS